MSHRPQHFDLVVTGTDARLAKAAVGKQAMLDLHAGTDDKWLFKVRCMCVGARACTHRMAGGSPRCALCVCTCACVCVHVCAGMYTCPHACTCTEDGQQLLNAFLRQFSPGCGWQVL